MGFGLSKLFVIFFILSILFWQATSNIWNGVVLLGIFIGVKIIWNLLTK